MLRIVSNCRGFTVEAKDGSLGMVGDFLFDDTTWKLRWMVVDTGQWLTGRKVLVHPSSIGHIDDERRELNVGLTKAQVENSPDIARHLPVSQKMQSELYGYYGWNTYRGGELGVLPNGQSDSHREKAFGDLGLDDGNPHLRSAADVTGYHVHARGGRIGHVENLLAESSAWEIRYLIIDTKNWWSGKHVLISPYAVKSIDWLNREIGLDIDPDKVKSSPAWVPVNEVDQAHEQQLHSHFHWPG